MNPMPCKYESDTVQALQCGEASAALIQHQQTCVACREILQLAEFLRRDARGLAAAFTPPPAAMVWAAAERHRRAASLAQATRVFSILKVVALAYIAIFLLWGLHALAVHASSIGQVLDGKSLSATLKGTAFAAILVGTGLWYAFRPDEPVTS